MKKKFLACTLAALMCLQPASAVLAEDLDFGEDSTGITEESHLLTEENTEDISDFISSDEEQDSSVSDAEPDLANSRFCHGHFRRCFLWLQKTDLHSLVRKS